METEPDVTGVALTETVVLAHEPTPLTDELVEFAMQIADAFESFLLAVRAVAGADDDGRAIPMLLLELAQVSLAGARLGAQDDFWPATEHQPDVGEDADVEQLRMRLADILGPVDTYGLVLDPYVPELGESQLSDDVATIAGDLENGLRHFRLGNTVEALWWWQFSYVSSWGQLATAALHALWSVVHHARLDVDGTDESEVLAAADEILGERVRGDR